MPGAEIRSRAINSSLPCIRSYDGSRGDYWPVDRASHRIAPTELVHGAALKLMAQDHVSARDRSHFLAYAGQVTRQVLIDEVHREGAEKCGPTRITLF